MKVVFKPISQIKPYARNARQNAETVTALVASISEFGFNQPLVIDHEGVIIVGHARFAAAQKLGMDRLPCVVSDMPPDKAQRYRIADNKIAEQTEWDMEVLLAELKTFDDAAASMSQYFGDTDLKKLLKESTGQAEKPMTEDKMWKARERTEAKFTPPPPGSLVNLICPHCALEFAMTRVDLEAAMTKATEPAPATAENAPGIPEGVPVPGITDEAP